MHKNGTGLSQDSTLYKISVSCLICNAIYDALNGFQGSGTGCGLQLGNPATGCIEKPHVYGGCEGTGSGITNRASPGFDVGCLASLLSHIK